MPQARGVRSLAVHGRAARVAAGLLGLASVAAPLMACAPPAGGRGWALTPSVVARSLGEAEAELQRRGLRLADVTLRALAGPRAGTVVAQEPSAGVRVRRGEPVALTIAVPHSAGSGGAVAEVRTPAPAPQGVPTAPGPMAGREEGHPDGGRLIELGRAALSDGRPAEAAQAAREFLRQHAQDERRAVAALLLARALEETGERSGAIAALAEAAALSSPPAPMAEFAWQRAGELQFAAGRAAEGWVSMEQAWRAAERSPAGARADVSAALAARYRAAGNLGQAASHWRAALEWMVEARRPESECAEVAWRLVQTYDALGRRDLANAVRARIVGEWPRTPQAAQAMDDLGAVALPAIQRGAIAFANQRWAQAADALTWYLNNGAPEGGEDEARYMRAIALTRLGRGDAVAALDRVADRHPESRWAAEALWEAGSLLLAQANRPAAAARLERLAVDYPQSVRRGAALHQLGTLLPGLGNAAAGRRYLEAAASAGREDHATFRARAAVGISSPAPKGLAGEDRITAQERAAWEAWLAPRTGRGAQELAALSADVRGDLRYRRAVALLDAGYEDAARVALRDVVSAYGDDPEVLAVVAVTAHERGAYAYSTLLGRRLLDALAGLGEPSLLAAPRLAQKLAYPLAYWELVEPAARAKGVDPLLLLGLMMQESAFQPRAASWANARGLTQFIPGTARAVAAELAWPNWTWDDMNRPSVSIPFGAHYLSGLLAQFGGVIHFAAAGYNGGPGNVARWASAGGADSARNVDAFMAGIDYPETRGYVRAVTTNHELYKAIYYR